VLSRIMVTDARALTLLEREPALEALAAALAKATAGQGRVALVFGEAGIGKTSLVEHFVRARAGSARTLWGDCDSLHTPRPLGPVYDLARDRITEVRVLDRTSTAETEGRLP
jgi:predicted ATPase